MLNRQPDAKTRLETVDASEQTRDELLIFARNFAAEADRMQADAATIQRLEAWLRGGPDREVIADALNTCGLEVVLRADGEDIVTAAEHPAPEGNKYAGDVAIAKKPGLAATINAALDEWEKVN